MAKKNKNNQLVKKEDTATLSNVLNEMITNKMTLQELRFFLVYLSKINPKNPDQTEVSFTLKEYSEALGVELNEATIGKVTDDLMRKIVHVRPKVISDEFYEVIIKTQLFRRCIMARRKSDNQWIFTFDASEDVKPHLFDLKSEYTSFEIWNTLNLGNVQDARMYMLLKQYRTVGERTIELRELKRMLGIDVEAYPQYPIFARDVLKKCQKSLKKCTDICFEFSAVGRPAKSVHFDISENKDYKLPKFLEGSKELEGQQTIPGVIDIEADPAEEDDGLWPWEIEDSDDQKEWAVDPRENNYKSDLLRYLAGAVDYEFPEEDIQVLLDLIMRRDPYVTDQQWMYGYIRSKYNYLNAMAAKKGVPNRFSYLKGAVANDWS